MSKNAYAEAGVDIDLEATAIKALIGNLKFRRKGSTTMMGSVGHFAGLIDFGEMALALTTDGVGTKMLVADRMEDWSTVGIDCIAMNVNDLYVMNVEPVAFVDYIATDKLSIEKMSQIGIGLNEGARQANIDIVGGETASLRGLVNGLDLAGTCLGMQKKDRIITGERSGPAIPLSGSGQRVSTATGSPLPGMSWRSTRDTLSSWGTGGHSGRNCSSRPGFTTRP